MSPLGGVLVPVHLFGKSMPMPTLVTDPEQLSGADPLAPAFPMNSAKLLSRLTRGQSGERIAGGHAALRDPGVRGAGQAQPGQPGPT